MQTNDEAEAAQRAAHKGSQDTTATMAPGATNVGGGATADLANEAGTKRSPGLDSRVESREFCFSEALFHVKRGRRCARRGWKGEGMFIFLVPGSTFKVNREPLLSILGEGTEVNYHGHVDMRTATGEIVAWLASQTDLLAEDWSFV